MGSSFFSESGAQASLKVATAAAAASRTAGVLSAQRSSTAESSAVTYGSAGAPAPEASAPKTAQADSRPAASLALSSATLRASTRPPVLISRTFSFTAAASAAAFSARSPASAARAAVSRSAIAALGEGKKEVLLSYDASRKNLE